jgi:hypothetical protein
LQLDHWVLSLLPSRTAPRPPTHVEYEDNIIIAAEE